MSILIFSSINFLSAKPSNQHQQAVSLSSIITTNYVYGPSGLVAKVSDDNVEFAVNDRLGSTRAFVDSDGEKVAEFKSLPFGQEIINEDVRYSFTGKELDNTSLHYFGARYYDSSTGRFTSTDPVADNHAYSYVSNNPMNMIDPNGMEAYVSDKNKQYYFNLFADISYELFENEVILGFDEDNHLEIVSKSLNLKESDNFWDKRKVLNMIQGLINSPKEVELTRSFGSDYHFSVSIDLLGNFETLFEIAMGSSYCLSDLNLGKGFDKIEFNDVVVFVHEATHASFNVRGKSYGEDVAVYYENLARSLLGLREREYYKVDVEPIQIYVFGDSHNQNPLEFENYVKQEEIKSLIGGAGFPYEQKNLLLGLKTTYYTPEDYEKGKPTGTITEW